MSDWTSRGEQEPCCPGPDGSLGAAVGDEETVARLLHTKITEPEGRPFRREELFPQKGRQHENECGNAGGASVLRSDNLSDQDLRARAARLAARVPGREQQGAVQAPVNRLRMLRLEGAPNSQVVFIYDDPDPADALHAVLRGKETLSRPLQSELRTLIDCAFDARVPAEAGFQDEVKEVE